MAEERRADYTDLMIQHERELRTILVQHEREMREQEAKLKGEQLKLQAVEYERRLAHLNDSFARADEVKNTFLPRETFAGFERADREWKDSVMKSMAEGRGATNRVAMMGVALAIIALLWRILPFLGAR